MFIFRSNISTPVPKVILFYIYLITYSSETEIYEKNCVEHNVDYSIYCVIPKHEQQSKCKIYSRTIEENVIRVQNA